MRELAPLGGKTYQRGDELGVLAVLARDHDVGRGRGVRREPPPGRTGSGRSTGAGAVGSVEGAGRGGEWGGSERGREDHGESCELAERR
jgi:hypothetical protein